MPIVHVAAIPGRSLGLSPTSIGKVSPKIVQQANRQRSFDRHNRVPKEGLRTLRRPSSIPLLLPLLAILPLMTTAKLLVSLQSAAELELIEGCGLPWIDLKNPSAGSLGCPSASVIQAFLQRFSKGEGHAAVTLSLAVGELLEEAWREVEEFFSSFDFIKVALAGCAQAPGWESRLEALCQSLGDPRKLVLTHYADHPLADAPAWKPLLSLAAKQRSSYLLIDTFQKSAGRLWDWYSPADLQRMALEAKLAGIQLSLAGSLELDELGKAVRLGASVVGLRGALCRNGSRTGSLCRDRLMQALDRIGQSPSSSRKESPRVDVVIRK
jgi:uncharacterized protein (UPF0264 family)